MNKDQAIMEMLSDNGIIKSIPAQEEKEFCEFLQKLSDEGYNGIDIDPETGDLFLHEKSY